MIRSHVVVDGSNIATEGRTTPSLRQLDDAVTSFMEEHHVDTITVIVDATFPNRIDQSERAEYEAALLAGELVTPPAGTIGRGDAFILQVAEKVGATVLSNDSFQELHAVRPWVFEEGRLIGGKPVPGVGWVFALRTPVRGPVSRRTTRDARSKDRAQPAATASTDGTKTPQPRRERSKNDRSSSANQRTAANDPKSNSEDRGTNQQKSRRALEPLNEPLHFLEFVAAHPIGSSLSGTIESFSSHGVYVRVGNARCYSPLKLLGNPAPRTARDVLKLGEEHTFAVYSIDTPRRGIDLALVSQTTPTSTSTASARPRSNTNSTLRAPDVTSVSSAQHSSASTGAARDTSIHVDVVVGTNEQPHGNAEEAKMAVKKAAVRKTAKKAPAKKTAAKRTAKKAPAKKTAAKRTAKKAPAKKTAAKRTAKKAPARRVAKKATRRR
jgi:hypothetical protein